VAFRLKKNESASAGIRRVAREEIDEAIDLLEDQKADPAEAVHELRKQFKKIRAIVRLVRDELGDEVFQRENRALRDLGRRLSAARDAKVRVSALDLLQKEEKGKLARSQVAPIRKRLDARHRVAVRRSRRPEVLSQIESELRALRRRARTWPLGKAGFACLESGLRRAYRDGRRAETEAYRARTDEAFHEWRKRAKDLRYQLGLLEPAWPEVMKDVERGLHGLTDRLGDDHDLADLRRVLNGRNSANGAKRVEGLADRIAHRRSVLQAQAQPIGARIYSEKPGRFSARIESYWDAWRS
jgi:CHAD domain-containing protein